MTTSISKLAWRNLWRHKRRTQLLLAVVAYATVAIIFFWGYYDGFVGVLLGGQARYLNAPALVQTESYRTDPDPENSLPTLDFTDDLTNIQGARGFAPRLEFPALLRSPYRTLGGQARGIDPALEPQVSDLPGDIGEGRMMEAPGEVVLGAKLAEELDVRVGERLALDVQSVGGAQGAGLQVVGFISSDIDVVDENMVLVHLEDARSLTGVATATGVALDIRQGDEGDVAAALNAASVLPERVQAYPIEALLGGLMAMLEQSRSEMYPIVLIFALFAAVTVMSTVIVSVIERTREFGVMTALGLNQGQLARMVTLEAVYTSFLGFLIGAVAGYALNWVVTTTNIMGAFMKDLYGNYLEGLALSDTFVLASSLGYLGWAAITILLAAILSITIPGRRVRQLNPAEAMRAN